MSNNKKINPKARGIYIVCLIVAEVAGFALIKPNSVVGAGLVGGGAALVAILVSKFIAEQQGIDFYKSDKQDVQDK
jgi:hypothetical protein